MEALERLQAVHAHLRLLHTHAIATPHGPSNRFLADFLLLLGASSRDPKEMERLCGVLVDAVPKMWATSLFHDMAHMNKSGAESGMLPKLPMTQTVNLTNPVIESGNSPQGCNDPQEYLPISSLNVEMTKDADHKPTERGQENMSTLENCEITPMVSLKDMERARSTTEDFCRSYFMFHGMDAHNPAHVFRHLPILVFTESYIYQLDEQNEDQLCPLSPNGTTNPDHLPTSSIQKTSSGRQRSSGRDPFTGLRAALSLRGLLTKRIEDELNEGLQYWQLEQSLCTALSSKTQVKVEDVMQAIHLKSFDYRVLNLLMYGLWKEPVDEAHYEFLSVSELLVEIADDLFDYEEDVGKNSFNVLRMFLYMYGPRQAPTMLAKFIGESEDKYQALLEGLEENIGAQYRRRCEEAVKEGGSKSVHALGSWTIPPLIIDEDAFRKQINGN